MLETAVGGAAYELPLSKADLDEQERRGLDPASAHLPECIEQRGESRRGDKKLMGEAIHTGAMQRAKHPGRPRDTLEPREMRSRAAPGKSSATTWHLVVGEGGAGSVVAMT
jgi:hypothetical protein